MFEHWFVDHCAGCGGTLPPAAGLCSVCAAELPRVAHACPLCGLATPAAHCPRRGTAWHVVAVVAPLVYRPPVDFYLHALKYRGRRPLGRALALALAPTFAAAAGSVDALVAVPLHAARHRERGYNQAEELARTLANEFGLPLLRRAVERRVRTASQTMASAHERRANVANAFAGRGDGRGLRLAIVDDVITTGATVNALAAALLAAGAAHCAAWAVARTLEA
jgi:ComF family protein